MNGPTPPTIDWLRFPKPVPLRKVWPTEPAHFTPWLAHNLHVLEVTGLAPLELVDTEVAIPGTGRALDILARLGTGELVAIENQFATAERGRLFSSPRSYGLRERAHLELRDVRVRYFPLIGGRRSDQV